MIRSKLPPGGQLDRRHAEVAPAISSASCMPFSEMARLLLGGVLSTPPRRTSGVAWADSLKMPVGSPVIGSCCISPPGGSGVVFRDAGVPDHVGVHQHRVTVRTAQGDGIARGHGSSSALVGHCRSVNIPCSHLPPRIISPGLVLAHPFGDAFGDDLRIGDVTQVDVSPGRGAQMRVGVVRSPGSRGGPSRR